MQKSPSHWAVAALLLNAFMIASCAKPSFDLNIKSAAPQLSGKLAALHLSKDHPYVLSINGKAGQDGNDQLKAYGNSGGEGYYDFDEKYSDSQGALVHEFEVTLPPGNYDVTFLLKDKSRNYRPVFTRDHVRFAIKP